MWPGSSEEHLQAELDLSRCANGVHNPAGIRIGIRGAVRSLNKNTTVREAKIGVVENVECLGPKLNRKLVRDTSYWRVFYQSKIQVREPRTARGTPSEVSVGADSGKAE